MKVLRSSAALLACLWLATAAAAPPAKPPIPDLTAGGTVGDGRDWTLGPTGARGWVYGWRGYTRDSRQILVTAVAKGSPADGVLAKGDVILKYMADEARSLKQYGELPENIRVNDTDAMMEGEENENAEYVDLQPVNELSEHESCYSIVFDPSAAPLSALHCSLALLWCSCCSICRCWWPVASLCAAATSTCCVSAVHHYCCLQVLRLR